MASPTGFLCNGKYRIIKTDITCGDENTSRYTNRWLRSLSVSLIDLGLNPGIDIILQPRYGVGAHADGLGELAFGH